MQTGERITLSISDVAFGGRGIGRSPAGIVVMVPFAAVGDGLDVEITRVRKRHCEARILGVADPGPGRVDPVCPYYGRCAGCQYQHLGYDRQLAVKSCQLSGLLQRIGGLAIPPGIPVVSDCGHAYGYRNKLRLHPLPHSGGQVPPAYGFYGPDNRTLVAVAQCPLAMPQLNALLPQATAACLVPVATRGWPPRDVVLRYAALSGACFRLADGSPGPHLRESLLGREVRVALSSFWQVNPYVSDRLVRTSVEWLAEDPPATLIDAYAGVGAFSLACGGRVGDCVLIEQDAAAVRAARVNHEHWGLAGRSFVRGTTEKVLPRVLTRLGKRLGATAVVLDPPRSGCLGAVTDALVRTPCRRVLYASCNPATLARDLKRLCAQGVYEVARLEWFDMFPQTAHFETLAMLVRG